MWLSHNLNPGKTAAIMTTTARRLDLILELKTDKKIWICDMACPQQNNIGAKGTEKLMKYRQLVFETRERRPGYKIYVVPVVVGALGSGIKALKVDLKKISIITNC